MNKGDAKSWKAQYVRSQMNDEGEINLGAWTEFWKLLIEAFLPYDAPGDALKELTNLKIGNHSIEDHISQFKVLLQKLGVLKESPAAIDYFRRTLNVPLQQKLLKLPTPPKELKDWQEWAVKLDNNYRKMQRILGWAPGRTNNRKKKEEGTRRWNFQRKDPNAMDIDALTTEKRDEMMRKGQCFGCGKPRHLNKDCPEKKRILGRYPTPPTYASTWGSTSSTSQIPRKMNPKELTAHIWSLTALYDEKEKEEFLDEAEKEGF